MQILYRKSIIVCLTWYFCFTSFIILILGFGKNKIDSNCCWNILGQNTATYQQSATKYLFFFRKDPVRMTTRTTGQM